MLLLNAQLLEAQMLQLGLCNDRLERAALVTDEHHAGLVCTAAPIHVGTQQLMGIARSESERERVQANAAGGRGAVQGAQLIASLMLAASAVQLQHTKRLQHSR